jgi:glucose-1-phosphate cytidylyltransferase
MIVIILAGGRGSRLGADVPKPMVEIGGIPMLSHIMGIYRKYGHNKFVIATGYKGEVIREYYKDDDSVFCLNTGLDTGTGARVRECALRIESDDFLLTYGDGLADIDIRKLVFSHKNAVTVTAVHPPARFGQLVLKGEQVHQFNEKPVGQHEWINGGFFVVDAPFAVLHGNDSWELSALPYAADRNILGAYKHEGFWQCMDTQRDVDYLNQLWKDGAPWL